jgi:hypothetical protein
MRSLALAGVALPFLPFAQWPTIMAGISAISPFVSLSAAMGSRHPAWLGLLGLPLVILAIFKRRWFCWHLCPTGFILELAAFRRRAGQQPPAGCPHIGKWLLITGIGMAAAGYPLLTILDPLQILSGFFNALQWKPNEWKVFAAAIPFLALLILNFLRPNVWCRWLCPLGAAQQFLGTAGSTLYHHLDCCRPASQACGKTNSSGLAEDIAQTNEIKPAPPAKGIQRRVFLMTCLGGIAGWAFTARKTRAAVVRPPGALRALRQLHKRLPRKHHCPGFRRKRPARAADACFKIRSRALLQRMVREMPAGVSDIRHPPFFARAETSACNRHGAY